jgi:hypothetical protein
MEQADNPLGWKAAFLLTKDHRAVVPPPCFTPSDEVIDAVKTLTATC